uniref:Calmodulin-binding domain-containing protein n=1 Tax=Cannabis sativa TaxID=3483 RepID=A0A803QKU0_CANSA
MAEESITPPIGKKEKLVPHYLRASTGSCHDFCKFGKKHEAEELARYPIPKRLAAKLSASRRSIETAADSSSKRNSSTVKLKNSPGSRTYSPKDGNISNGKALTRSLDSLNVVKTDERKKPSSAKHEAASALPSKPKTMKQKLSASTEKLELSSKKSSTTKAKPKSFSGKNQTFPNLNSAAVKPLSSPESSGRLNGNGETRIGKRTGSTVAPKKGLASPKVSLPNKTSPTKSVVSLNRKQQGSLKKNASPLETNNEVRIAEPTESKNGEVPEKTLYVIKMETEKKTLESNQNETCDAEVESLPYILSLSPKSSPLPECLSSPSSSPLPGGCSSSESEDYTFSEDSETESMENSDTLDSNNKMRRSSGLVCEEEDDDKGSKLKFRRGKVVDMHTENDAPRKLKFRRGRVLENQNVTADARRRRFKKREEVDDTNAEAGSEKVVLKHQDVQGKKDAQGLFNNVIEETASKLAETRKSKVKALVGAFETVISLQDKKPSNTAS